jgi:hypothetical protein
MVIKFYRTHLIFTHTGYLGLELHMKLKFRSAGVEGSSELFMIVRCDFQINFEVMNGIF